MVDVLKNFLSEVEGDKVDQSSPQYGNAVRKIVDAMHLLEPLVSNHQQAWLALHQSRIMSLLLTACELVRTAILHTHAKKAGQMARLALSMLAQLTLQQEGRTQLLSLEIPQSKTHFVLIIINLMQTDWSESLDHNQSLDLVESGFRTLRQMTLTSEVQKFVNSFPSLMLDLSDMILLYADTPSILKEIKGLMFNFRSIRALPAHLEQLIKNDVAAPQNELIMNQIMQKTDPPNISQNIPVPKPLPVREKPVNSNSDIQLPRLDKVIERRSSHQPTEENQVYTDRRSSAR